jgi:hypothetical protein
MISTENKPHGIVNICMKIHEVVQTQYASLYHGADIVNLASIIISNTLEEGFFWGRPHEPHGVRLTRDRKTAWSFGESELDMPTILEFDQNKIRQRYRIVPYKDVDAGGFAWGDEMEEVVLTSHLPVRQFLIAFYVKPEFLKEAKKPDMAEYAMTERNFMSEQEYYKAIDILSTHPLRRIPPI